MKVGLIISVIHPYVIKREYILEVPNNNLVLLKFCKKSRKENYSTKQKGPCSCFLSFGQRVSILIPFPINVCYRWTTSNHRRKNL